MKFGTGSYGPFPCAKFHVYRGNVSPMRGEKPIFGPSKNNTGMAAALRASLPVMMTFSFPTSCLRFRCLTYRKYGRALFRLPLLKQIMMKIRGLRRLLLKLVVDATIERGCLNEVKFLYTISPFPSAAKRPACSKRPPLKARSLCGGDMSAKWVCMGLAIKQFWWLLHATSIKLTNWIVKLDLGIMHGKLGLNYTPKSWGQLTARPSASSAVCGRYFHCASPATNVE